jgi:pyridoxamine 5'-phosphate oxidase
MNPDPLARFLALLEDAQRAYPETYNGMTLSTVGPDGRPSSRVVLLKAADARGFVFYTNLLSRKGRELAGHPFAALNFWWPALESQVRVEGPVVQVPDAEADAYFATRPRGSQLGAWTSHQSDPLPDRAVLEERMAALEAQYEGRPVPRPPHWSGLQVVPDRIEFWKDRQNRLHDRELYVRPAPGAPWSVQHLNP